MKIMCPSCAWIFFSIEFSLHPYFYGHCPLHECFPPDISQLQSENQFSVRSFVAPMNYSDVQ